MAATNVGDRELIEAALAAQEQAYAPYSNYRVGAAVRCADGGVWSGCNVENASFGLTVCAERVAIWSAVAAGRRAFQTLAVVTVDGGYPCGACRQVLAEFALDLRVLVVDSSTGTCQELTVRDLLPHSFEFPAAE